ncbi:MAG: DUF4912 domain-containing protein [Deltaproteobacteria bacterium]|nr:DUF4912 domain-containing protein [Deltaproteobacteria bacterium]
MSEREKTYREMTEAELAEAAERLGLTHLRGLSHGELVDLLEQAAARARRSRPPSAPARAVTPRSTPRSRPAATPPLERVEKASAPVPPARVEKATTPPPARVEKATTPPPAAAKAKDPAPRPAARADDAAARAELEPRTPVERTPKVAREEPVATAPERRRRAERAAPAAAPQSAPPSAPPSAPRVRRAGDGHGAAPRPAPATGPVLEEALRTLDDGLAELPEDYQDNRIVLLPRDPAHLFCYWSLTAEYRAAARDAGGTILALRVCDVTGIDPLGGQVHAVYEHDCVEWARSWYLPVPMPGRTYVVEIGYRGSGQWLPLARSNAVVAPRDQVEQQAEEVFVTIPFEMDLRRVAMTWSEDEETPAARGPGAASRSPSRAGPPVAISGLTGATATSPGGVGEATSFAGASEREVVGGALPAAGAPIPEAASGGAGAATAAAFPTAFAGAASVSWYGPSSVSIGVPSVPEPGAAPGEAAPGVGITRPLLQAEVELLVFGRTVPGATVYLDGHAVPVGPDGCFSLRVSVPEAVREVPIEAQLPHGGAVQRLRICLNQIYDG